MKEMVDLEGDARQATRSRRHRQRDFRSAKRDGISDAQLAQDLEHAPNSTCATRRKELGVQRGLQPRGYLRRGVRELHAVPLFDLRSRSAKPSPADRKKVMILGSGPNRIGQGIEFDYCCCHASFALQEFGVESIMVNCNPETVSTDYDTSDRLYFEPLTLEERAEHLRHREARRRDRAVRRADAAESGAAAEARRRADHRHRSRRTSIWPKTASSSASCSTTSKIPCARQRHRHQRGRGLRRWRARIGYPGAGAAQLRARRPRHGDRLRRGDGAPVHARSRHLLAGPAGADRPISRRRHRSRRRRAVPTATTS